MRKLKRLVLALIVIAACARQGAPPGGPPRIIPPILLSTFPDSNVAPCDFRGFAEFRFDEVTSEGSTPNFGDGRGSLEQLIVFSPDTLVPQVAWHRDRIAVRPRGGWRPNRTYRIELLPGVADLHQNISKSGAVITFTTCGPPATRVLTGRAVDWTARQGLRLALIEAYHLPDSARYRTQADSAGRFRFTELPDGPYLVFAISDADRSHRRNGNEPWDSVRVAATSNTAGEIWTFQRDTLPPRITNATRQDSQSIVVTFFNPIDPALRLDSTSVRVRLLTGNDSVSIGTRYAFPTFVYDSIQKLIAPPPPVLDSAGRADSARKDSIARATPAPLKRPLQAPPGGRAPAPVLAPVDSLVQKRPPLGNTLVIRTFGQVVLGQRYVIDLIGIRSADGRTSPPLTRVVSSPPPPTAADSAKAAKAKADSIAAKAKADSIAGKIKPDSANPVKVIRP